MQRHKPRICPSDMRLRLMKDMPGITRYLTNQKTLDTYMNVVWNTYTVGYWHISTIISVPISEQQQHFYRLYPVQ